MLAERMAAGVAEGLYQVEHMAAVTFTRKAAAELRGRFHLALERALQPTSGTPDAGERAPGRRLSNLERFFAGTIHSFCARLLRERPVESGVAPGFTELDEVPRTRPAAPRLARLLIASAAPADPLLRELLEAGIKPKDLDRAFATVCSNDEVEFPAGDAPRPDPAAGARRRSRRFWAELHRDAARRRSTPTRRAGSSEAHARASRRSSRVAGSLDDAARGRRAARRRGTASPKIVQKWWADDGVREEAAKDDDRDAARELPRATVEPFLAQWRQYVYRLAVTLLDEAPRATPPRSAAAGHAQLRRPAPVAARVLRENAGGAARAPAEVPLAVRGRVPGHRPRPGRGVPAAGRATPSASERDWRACRCGPARSSSSAIPKQSIYRFRRADIDIYNIVRAADRGARRAGSLPLTMNFRSVPALCEWANTAFRRAFPARPRRSAALRRARPARSRAGAAFGVRVIDVPDTVCEGDDVARTRPTRSRATSAPRSTPAAARYSDFLDPDADRERCRSTPRRSRR